MPFLEAQWADSETARELYPGCLSLHVALMSVAFVDLSPFRLITVFRVCNKIVTFARISHFSTTFAVA